MFALVVLALPSLLVPGILRVRGPVAYSIGALVTAAAVVVAGAIVASVAGSHFGTAGMLILELGAAGAAIAAWRYYGRPELRKPTFRSCGSAIAMVRRNGL